MAAWTQAQDVIDAWIGDDAPVDLELVQRWVDKAERLVKFHVPDISARITSGEEPDLLADVQDVVTEMVHRVFRNPEGIRQVQETTGPFTGSRTYGGDVPGGLGITDDEVDRLSGRKAPGEQQAFSFSLIPPTSPFYPGGVS